MRGCSKLGTIVVDRVPVVVIHAGHGSGEVRGRSVDFLVSATEEHAGPAGVKECPQAAVEAATVPSEQHLGVDAAPLKLLGGAVGDDPVADEADVVRHLTEAAEREAEYLTIDAVLVESFLDRSRVVRVSAMELVVESLGFAPVLTGDAVLTAVDGLDIAVGVVEVGFTGRVRLEVPQGREHVERGLVAVTLKGGTVGRKGEGVRDDAELVRGHQIAEQVGRGESSSQGSNAAFVQPFMFLLSSVHVS